MPGLMAGNPSPSAQRGVGKSLENRNIKCHSMYKALPNGFQEPPLGNEGLSWELFPKAGKAEHWVRGSGTWGHRADRTPHIPMQK